MSEQRPPVPQDLLRLHPVGEPRFSPDGRTLAYVVQEFDRLQDTVISDIWVVRVPDGSPHRITSGAGRKFSP
ncbi:MAG: dapb3 2, partial [Firmicutes bacterium]|nr:dapb3 2 [Bacillota bacterium]